MKVAVVHDYLTQRGGAERVVLSILKAFPDAPVYTSLFEPRSTFEEFRHVDVRPMPLNAVAPLRANHRLALPALAPAFSRLEVDADVVICSSSGWAHGATVHGVKVVYCHTPARWLYQPRRYLRDHDPRRLALALLHPRLQEWDRRAAASADRYLANSTEVQRRIEQAYGIDAEVLHPPYAVDPAGVRRSVDGVAPGFFLCVSRLLAYKNVDAVVRAFARLPGERLVVVGTGPLERELRAVAGPNVRFLRDVGDAELRWLYASCAGVVSASYEDFGLVAIEAAAFGKPALALRFGGFLDTVVDGVTGLLFDAPAAEDVAAAVGNARAVSWDPVRIRAHAGWFSEDRFVSRLRELVSSPAAEVRELEAVTSA